jgi:Ca-activated chloride channel family protein
VTFSGLELNKSFSKTISINNKFNAVGLDVLWAKRRIENLMDEYINTSDSKKRADIKDRIIKLGLENHLVTKFTALVAVDVTPSRPGDETLVSKPVAKKVKAPNTATNSELSILVGLLLLIISVFVRRLRTK